LEHQPYQPPLLVACHAANDCRRDDVQPTQYKKTLDLSIKGSSQKQRNIEEQDDNDAQVIFPEKSI
jgi:hypothetical protein